MDEPVRDEWQLYAEGTTIGTRGSEEGTVVIDQEYQGNARITLERDCRGTPFAITCGIYGWMVHTCFAGTLEEAVETFGRMKDDLERMVALELQQPNESDDAFMRRLGDATSVFVERYW